jgi:acyl-CoA synthetase (AMP-forming)/AMP-acid ligase II
MGAETVQQLLRERATGAGADRAGVYAVPDAAADDDASDDMNDTGNHGVGDQVMAALVLHHQAELAPEELTAFLATQADLPTKGWPRYVRIAPSLPSTATNKVLERELIARGATAGDGVLWVREERGTAYSVRH